MSTEPGRVSETAWFIGIVCLQALAIVIGGWWPDSTAETLARSVAFSWFAIWFSLKIRTGYRRRRPHWTRESWLRYLRLAVMPVVAIALVLFLSSFDPRTNALGAPHSATRFAWMLIMLALFGLGTVGLMTAIDWLEKGEPSEQFTRSRWLRSRSR